MNVRTKQNSVADNFFTTSFDRNNMGRINYIRLFFTCNYALPI